ncbi:DNA-binding GntR family transcriptional regulator [Pacificibacter maritimus]|uniref:DNA-binding GntR family transcriptional regulator n=1 Tax=Pacificibacter maritimus TaxID=762213 RepID=A0A3N4V0Y7_9RHOB|nr:GntR family transcriptional regulator [Pacificibacter maritimus]RPE66574.1 DNA-binding GntR family transcriptional regulator [Pacificibacter maritimus]
MLELIDIDAWKLDQQKAVSPQLRVVLRSRIIRNNLKPMSRLSEPELAKEYGVSRQPVREAFITLVDEGLLEIRPQRGTFVKKIDYEAVLNARFVREAVEADIIRQLASRPNAELVANLRQEIADQYKAASGSPLQFIELDERFHRSLAQAAGVARAWDYLEAIKSQMDRVRFMTFEEFPSITLVKQHEQVVDLIEQQDVKAAEEAMRSHLREILKSLPKVHEIYPEYFENSPGSPRDT